jgi:hypothetical protein
LYHVHHVTVFRIQLLDLGFIALVSRDAHLVASRQLMLVVLKVFGDLFRGVLVEEADRTASSGARCGRRRCDRSLVCMELGCDGVLALGCIWKAIHLGEWAFQATDTTLCGKVMLEVFLIGGVVRDRTFTQWRLRTVLAVLARHD